MRLEIKNFQGNLTDAMRSAGYHYDGPDQKPGLRAGERRQDRRVRALQASEEGVAQGAQPADRQRDRDHGTPSADVQAIQGTEGAEIGRAHV